MKNTTTYIKDISAETVKKVFGPYDENIKLLELRFDCDIGHRDEGIRVYGGEENAHAAKRVLSAMIAHAAKQGSIDIETTRYLITLEEKGMADSFESIQDDIICFTTRGKPVKAKTVGQHRYIEAIRQNDMVFGVGPAGTGKTYLAMAMAITAFKNGEVDRLILTRPAVEAGEKLGFLPGDLQDKVDPYLRPLYDALFDIMGPEAFERNMEKGLIEVAPLAYMRGRTLENAYIILDEAQNTTPEQMKMFLTRFGSGSKVIVTGDITQIDLPDGKRSGLKEAARILRKIKGIAFITFDKHDVVRHRLVQMIIEAYDQDAKRQKPKEKAHAKRESKQ